MFSSLHEIVKLCLFNNWSVKILAMVGQFVFLFHFDSNRTCLHHTVYGLHNIQLSTGPKQWDEFQHPGRDIHTHFVLSLPYLVAIYTQCLSVSWRYFDIYVAVNINSVLPVLISNVEKPNKQGIIQSASWNTMKLASWWTTPLCIDVN